MDAGDSQEQNVARETRRMESTMLYWLNQYRIPPRQRQVIMLILDGCTRNEVAVEMGTSRHTVQQQMHLIHERLGVQDSVQMLRVLLGKTARDRRGRTW